MAVIKHISVKDSNGGDALNYVLYKHNEKTGELIVDGRGNPVMRDEYYLDGINCEPYSFAAECKEVNDLYGKNQLPGDIKAHHFIISYDPKDGLELGLTGSKAQQLSMEWAERCLPGFQILVCTHMDGSNESGNIHTHIMMNSVRKCDTKSDDFGERAIDHLAGYKLNLTNNYLQYMKQELMSICEREGFYQVDLLSPAENHVTDKEYRVQQHGQYHLDNMNKRLEQEGKEFVQTLFQTQKQYLRDSIKDVVSIATTFEDFCSIMKEKYNITVRESRGRISYLHPEREKHITGRALGKGYEKDAVLKQISGEKITRLNVNERAPKSFSDIPTRIETLEDSKKVFVMHSELKLVVRLQEVAKAQTSATYVNKVMVSNVKAMAETILFVQQSGFKTVEDVREALSIATEESDRINGEILQEKEKLKSVNEDIHNMGQYLTYKKVFSEYMKTDNKREFAIDHEKELKAYKAAVNTLKKKYEGSDFPTMRELKKQKTESGAMIAQLKKQSLNAQKDQLVIEAALSNVKSMLNGKEIRKDIMPGNDAKVSKRTIKTKKTELSAR